MSPSSRLEQPESDPVAVPLRLIAAQGKLGIELYEPQKVGPVTVQTMNWVLPGLSFPVDLSGGVRSFCSRRGELARLELSTSRRVLAEWLARRVGKRLGIQLEEPSVWHVEGGVGIGHHTKTGTLAFNLLWVPSEESAEFVVEGERSVGFDGPALVHVCHFLQAALGDAAEVEGRRVRFGGLGARLPLLLLPPLGVRAPGAKQIRYSGFEYHAESWTVIAEKGRPPPELQEVAGRAVGLASLIFDADAALCSGDPDGARAAYLQALEKAPRHPEICRSIAELDCAHEERAEAALGLLVESLPATSFGVVGAELLGRVGDYDGAALAIGHQARAEAYAPLAAGLWGRLSEWAPDAAKQSEALEYALAACPGHQLVRWQRLLLRVNSGDVHGALADAQHLEAASRGAEGRYAVILRAARALQRSGYVAQAGRLFERALRYSPKDSEAALGLGLSLIETGAPKRAAALLERAMSSSEPSTEGRARLALAGLAATEYQDLPRAIALVQAVAADGLLTFQARYREAEWRALLGDLAGANLAFARMRQTLELTPDVDEQLAGSALLDAATFVRSQMDDEVGHERYLALALRYCPRDPRIQRAYRLAAKALSHRQRKIEGLPASSQATPDEAEADPAPVSVRPAAAAPTRPATAEPASSVAGTEEPGQAGRSGVETFNLQVDGEVASKAAEEREESWSEPVAAAPSPAEILSSGAVHLGTEDLELRADELKARFLMTPGDEALVEELSAALRQLGNYEELYALLFGQFEDSEGAARVALRRQLLVVLEELLAAELTDDQRELYELVRNRLNSPD